MLVPTGLMAGLGAMVVAMEPLLVPHQPLGLALLMALDHLAMKGGTFKLGC